MHKEIRPLPKRAVIGTLWGMMRDDFTLTKRQLGILLCVIGAAGFVAILGIDILDAGREGGIGPAQRLALGIMAGLALLGLTLLPLKDDPA